MFHIYDTTTPTPVTSTTNTTSSSIGVLGPGRGLGLAGGLGSLGIGYIPTTTSTTTTTTTTGVSVGILSSYQIEERVVDRVLITLSIVKEVIVLVETRHNDILLQEMLMLLMHCQFYRTREGLTLVLAQAQRSRERERLGLDRRGGESMTSKVEPDVDLCLLRNCLTLIEQWKHVHNGRERGRVSGGGGGVGERDRLLIKQVQERVLQCNALLAFMNALLINDSSTTCTTLPESGSEKRHRGSSSGSSEVPSGALQYRYVESLLSLLTLSHKPSTTITGSNMITLSQLSSIKLELLLIYLELVHFELALTWLEQLHPLAQWTVLPDRLYAKLPEQFYNLKSLIHTQRLKLEMRLFGYATGAVEMLRRQHEAIEEGRQEAGEAAVSEEEILEIAKSVIVEDRLLMYEVFIDIQRDSLLFFTQTEIRRSQRWN